MAKRCPNCKSEISRFQEFCFECGAEIKHVSKRPKHALGFDLKWFVVGLFLPVVGYVWFFFFSRDHYRESLSAFYGAIASSILSFVFYQVLSWIGFFHPVDPEDLADAIVFFIRLRG
ncbi:MAG: zinc ribbon domain-containing protein [Bacillus subtilis]|nr:zinc ribbon domain-containing protein [Bacillus subtilis]